MSPHRTFQALTLSIWILQGSAQFRPSTPLSFHWARTSTPATITVIDNLPTHWTQYLRDAVSEWSRSPVLDLTIRKGSFMQTCPATNGFITICALNAGPTNWLGLTQSMMDEKGHAVHSVITLNEFYFFQPQYNTIPARAHVVCHELGHALGLNHRTENGASVGSCMDTSISPASTKPDAVDFKILLDGYSHIDPYNSYTKTPATTTPTLIPRNTGTSNNCFPNIPNNITPFDVFYTIIHIMKVKN